MPPRKHHEAAILPLTQEHTYRLLLVLLVIVFCAGGGSRHDIESLVYLRPAACLTSAIGLLGLSKSALHAYRAPFLLLGAMATLMTLQLIPLPLSWWARLPSHLVIAQLDTMLGFEGLWRPITLSTMKTANSLASLVVPFAALVLFSQLDRSQQHRIFAALVIVAVASAIIGILQLFAGGESGLYFYRITQEHSAVGLFANRNHHAVFLSAAMLISLYIATSREAQASRLIVILCFIAALVLFLCVIGNASRGGLLSAAIALMFAPLVMLRSPPPPLVGVRRFWAAPFVLVALAFFALFAATQRSPALARLLEVRRGTEVRADLLPILIDMARFYQPWGSGFGAFEYAYRIFEPVELMEPHYFNNAHNDWLQLVIEGGAGAIVLIIIVLSGVVLRIVQLIRSEHRSSDGNTRTWLGLGILCVFGFASLFDYPLRVPSIMATAIIAFAIFTRPEAAE